MANRRDKKAGKSQDSEVDALGELLSAAGILGEDRAGDPTQEARLGEILGHYDADMRIALTQRVVSDESLKPIKIKRFCEEHALTGAEIKVVESLCLGRSMAEHAAEHFISPNTARTHLQRVREKTGISRQADIVSTVLA
ncbi:helix-turn-helix transcriptional regulator [Congregibacter brevis]|uniref:Helix-turn-helix transcriptional regulator n=1 Tax=Congregibacter brevis TaxID=3081201 RepID=A0ABZ0IEL3_9GAMM|nr:helix-turn-helix transcriptional regulator [Congregibacter sp. IMCC45268]